MTRAFIAGTITQHAPMPLSMADANRLTEELITAIVAKIKAEGRFSLPRFGTFVVHKRKARQARNPRTGEQIKVKASKTVRFKPSPVLKKAM